MKRELRIISHRQSAASCSRFGYKSGWLSPSRAIAVSAVLHRLVLVLEVLDRHGGVHVENDLADGVPLAALEEKDSRGVAERADRRQAFHVAALDGLKLDGDAGQGGELPAAPFARESHRTVPVAIFPAQTAGLAGCRCCVHEFGLQPLPLKREQFLRSLGLDLTAKKPQAPPK